MSNRKRILSILLAAAMLMTGCQTGKTELVLPNEHKLSSDSNSVNRLTDGTVTWKGTNICLPEGNSETDESIQAPVALLFGLDDTTVYFEKNVERKMNPASLTVLFTTATVLKYRELTDEVVIEDSDIKGLQNASTVGLKAGDHVTVEQLLYGMILCSGIDAANALARDISGDKAGFAALMNETAKQCGCLSSCFVNPNGLTEAEHKTTAYDIYLVLHRLMENEDFVRILGSGTYHAVYTDAQGQTVSADYDSTVKYIQEGTTQVGSYVILGGKTGTTAAAGNCLALVVQDDAGKHYLALVMKAATKESLYEQIECIVGKIKN